MTTPPALIELANAIVSDNRPDGQLQTLMVRLHTLGQAWSAVYSKVAELAEREPDPALQTAADHAADALIALMQIVQQKRAEQ